MAFLGSPAAVEFRSDGRHLAPATDQWPGPQYLRLVEVATERVVHELPGEHRRRGAGTVAFDGAAELVAVGRRGRIRWSGDYDRNFVH